MLHVIWEEDRSKARDIWKNRLLLDYGFRELLFGHYIRKYVHPKNELCTALRQCHYQTYLDQVNVLQPRYVRKTETPQVEKPYVKRVASYLPKRHPCIPPFEESQYGESPITRKTRSAQVVKRYWMYLRFLFRHRDLPHDAGDLDAQYEALYRLVIILEYTRTRLIGER